jgi:hypothetical protein
VFWAEATCCWLTSETVLTRIGPADSRRGRRTLELKLRIRGDSDGLHGYGSWEASGAD